jgi:multicomponent Na+:H+ antiporter subunit C
MENLLAITIGGLYAMAFYLLLRRSMVKVILGVLLFGQAVNLLIFLSAGLSREKAAFVPDEGMVEWTNYADPLPQALILTAIVIGFGVLAFTLALMRRTHMETQTDDLDRLKERSQ